MSDDDDRRKLLLQMYDQMFNDIDTHIKVIWQSLTVLLGAFAILALTEKKVISLDVAAALILLIAGWLVANLSDAGYWYNRNLAIIANIEKEFLRQGDLRDIHYYFGSHRPGNKMITHLRIQYAFGVGLAAIVILWHFVERIVPGIDREAAFDPLRSLPYVVAVAVVLYAQHLHSTAKKKYLEFVTNSPGRRVDTAGVQYGVGHGFSGSTEDSNLKRPPKR